MNFQGTGTTIMQISPQGTVSQFALINAGSLPGPCPGGVGLTTALAVLRNGWVIVGSLPTGDGTSTTAQAGCLLILNSHGNVVETIAGGPINGPWDMTALDLGDLAILFVTDVLKGTVAATPDPTMPGNVVNNGNVVRLDLFTPPFGKPVLIAETVIASGFAARTDPAALVIGPTGVSLDNDGDTLYVADSLNNRIAAIRDPLFRFSSAGTGQTVSQGGALNDPLGMTLAPNGDIITANGNDGNLVETSPWGTQKATKLVDDTGAPPGAGTLFGLVAVPNKGVYFVDDGSNSLNLLH